MKENSKNETMKRQYLTRLKLVKQRSDATIEAIERAVRRFEDANGFPEFGKFDRVQAQRFVESLRDSGVSAKTQSNTVVHVRSFFEWLSGQPGYRSRVRLDDVEYLSLDRKTTFEALEEKIVRFPPLEYVQQLTHSIKPITEVDRRDRALIALLLLSGMRVMAAATLSVGSFNPDLLEVRQYPSEGVATKRLKATTTYLWRIDPTLIDYVLEWHSYLVRTRLFANTDPLFPRTKVEREKESGLFEYSGVEPVFWRTDGPIRAILQERATLAGLEYFNPHAFRHLTAHLVLPLAKSPEQLQAIKQNFGHKLLGTTMDVYGKLMPSRQQEVVAAFTFRAAKASDLDEETVKRVMDGIKQAGFTLDKRA